MGLRARLQRFEVLEPRCDGLEMIELELEGFELRVESRRQIALYAEPRQNLEEIPAQEPRVRMALVENSEDAFRFARGVGARERPPHHHHPLEKPDELAILRAERSRLRDGHLRRLRRRKIPERRARCGRPDA